MSTPPLVTPSYGATNAALTPTPEQQMSEREETLKRLNDVHSFPGEYVFKIIGENTPQFVSRIVQACINVLGPESNPEVSTRESSGKKHVSVTVNVAVDDAETVLRVYDMLAEVDDIKFIL